MTEQICDYSCRSFGYFGMHGAACNSGGGIIKDEEIGKPCTLSEKLSLRYDMEKRETTRPSFALHSFH
ncbi:MAG: hypothetical protein Q8N99_04170 [Nanoarchaeota archaeon]|nr:hypothetical protein [Nanoarchaeota archaeon]